MAAPAAARPGPKDAFTIDQWRAPDKKKNEGPYIAITQDGKKFYYSSTKKTPITDVFKKIQTEITTNPISINKLRQIQAQCKVMQITHSDELLNRKGFLSGIRAAFNTLRVQWIESKFDKLETNLRKAIAQKAVAELLSANKLEVNQPELVSADPFEFYVTDPQTSLKRINFKVENGEIIGGSITLYNKQEKAGILTDVADEQNSDLPLSQETAQELYKNLSPKKSCSTATIRKSPRVV